MHIAAGRSLCFASKVPARYIAGRRRPCSRPSLRSFHSSPALAWKFPWGNFPSGPSDQDHFHTAVWNSEQNRWEAIGNTHSQLSPQQLGDQANAEARATGADPDNNNGGNGGGEKEKNGHYGSALRRSLRNKRPKEVPPMQIPIHFLASNVRRYKFDADLTTGILHLTGEDKDGVEQVAEDAADKSQEIASPKGSKPDRKPDSFASFDQSFTEQESPSNARSSTGAGVSSASESHSSSERDEILVRFYASLQECSQAYMEMEETHGPPGEDLENWTNLPDRLSEIPNLTTKYNDSAAEFEKIATQAFAAFPDGELARKVSSEPELGKGFAKHVDDLEIALREVSQREVAYREVAQRMSADISSSKPKPTTARKYFPQYGLNHALFSEVLASISAGLSLPRSENSDAFACKKSHLKLLCPIDGGIYFLDKVIEEAATRLRSDIVVLDPQDIAELAAEYISEGSDRYGNSLFSLGFDAAEVFNGPTAAERAEEEADGEEGAEEDVERPQALSSPKFGSLTAIPLSAAPREMQNIINKFFNGSGDLPVTAIHPPSQDSSNSFAVAKMHPRKGNTAFESKLNQLLETVVEANVHKRDFLTAERRKILSVLSKSRQSTEAESQQESTLIISPSSYQHQDAPSIIPLQGVLQFSTKTQTSNALSVAVNVPRTIILLRDFKEIRSTAQGAKVVDKIVDIVSKKRQDGQEIMLVGTSSSADLAENVSFSALESLQGEDESSVFRTLVITPDTNRGLYYHEERRRLRQINFRHLFGMLRRLDPAGHYEKHGYRLFSRHLLRELKSTHLDYLEEQMLSFDEAHRIMFTAMGMRNQDTNMDSREPRIQLKHIASAFDLIKKSDGVKANWAQSEYQIQNPPTESDRREGHSAEVRLKKLRKSCNNREKLLLRGVVNPENIQITFNDVHASPDTIEALKTLTTLSLTRPDAFKYGVLSKDRLSGLLLYGPPGTGKTLLAKAVAKQSGATMLEVSGSDLYDMYVGEGEKNVRAVFSLAKKLAPCVLFIDEADAIFGSRDAGRQRNSHRELINQFLREWDGMTDTSAFVMVATNRPFDVDDAALRRLPRRILVDLPSEKDREAILGIHLKEEELDASVSIAKLASQTPLYSGSDLKNVAVAAALAAVREETEEASKHTGDEPYKYPIKRILSVRHFDKALEEISASINEDMSSLGAIRKFDEKYGDRRGRRKKATYGFSSDGVKKDETAKVRTWDCSR